jgi:translation initiation factor IF-2
MSENNPSDTTPTPASVETAAAPAAPALTEGFGTSRGTGLARGKRPARPVQNNAGSPAAAYQPSAVQVLVAKTEYVNPFATTPEIEPAPAPHAESQPVPVADPAPLSPPPAAPSEEPAPAAAAFAPALASETAPAPAAAFEAPAPTLSAQPEPKAQLNILPPAAPRPTTSWESTAAAPAESAGDRPVFCPERKPIIARELNPLRPVEGARHPEGARHGGGNTQRRDGRGSRRDGAAPGSTPRRDGDTPERRREGGTPDTRRPERRADAPRPAPAAQEKAGGFLGWLKGIFAGGSPSEAPAPGDEITRDTQNRGQGGRGGQHLHRGGRGRGPRSGSPDAQASKQNPGARPESPRQEGPRDSGPGGEGGRRRRRRGGRGRGGPRPEGQGRPSGDSGPAQPAS